MLCYAQCFGVLFRSHCAWSAPFELCVLLCVHNLFWYVDVFDASPATDITSRIVHEVSYTATRLQSTHLPLSVQRQGTTQDAASSQASATDRPLTQKEAKSLMLPLLRLRQVCKTCCKQFTWLYGYNVHDVRFIA